MVIDSVGSQQSQQVNATSDQQEMEIHLALMKALCLQLSQDVAVWELNEELTVLHSVKLVKATLQGAGVLPGALLHMVRSTGLITC